MSTKEMVMKEIEKISENEPILDIILEILKGQSKGVKIHRTFKGRPVVKVEELAKINCPYSKEPDWKEYES